MLDLYSSPDWDLLTESSNTLWSCTRQQNDDGLCIVPVTLIQSVVAIVPHIDSDIQVRRDLSGRLYVVEKMGLDVMQMAGVVEDMHDRNDMTGDE